MNQNTHIENLKRAYAAAAESHRQCSIDLGKSQEDRKVLAKAVETLWGMLGAENQVTAVANIMHLQAAAAQVDIAQRECDRFRDRVRDLDKQLADERERITASTSRA